MLGAADPRALHVQQSWVMGTWMRAGDEVVLQWGDLCAMLPASQQRCCCFQESWGAQGLSPGLSLLLAVKAIVEQNRE